MTFDIWNRRYTGSKYKLSEWIVDLIHTNCSGKSFCDIFAGTAIMSKQMLNSVEEIYINSDGKLLVDYFKKLGIKEFEYVVATHPHEDHIGGMDDVISNFSVKNFYMPESSYPHGMLTSVRLQTGKRGQTSCITNQ